MGSTVFGGAEVVWGLIGLAWMWGIAVAIAMPFLAFRAVRNLAGIRKELARLNDNIERGSSSAPPAEGWVRTSPISFR
jgi:ABC-type long-subunit fatty acid transport system fused permease/ATPase subunit